MTTNLLQSVIEKSIEDARLVKKYGTTSSGLLQVLSRIKEESQLLGKSIQLSEDEVEFYIESISNKLLKSIGQIKEIKATYKEGDTVVITSGDCDNYRVEGVYLCREDCTLYDNDFVDRCIGEYLLGVGEIVCVKSPTYCGMSKIAYKKGLWSRKICYDNLSKVVTERAVPYFFSQIDYREHRI